MCRLDVTSFVTSQQSRSTEIKILKWVHPAGEHTQHNVLSFHFGTWLPSQQCFKFWWKNASSRKKFSLLFQRQASHQEGFKCAVFTKTGTGSLKHDTWNVGIIRPRLFWRSVFWRTPAMTPQEPLHWLISCDAAAHPSFDCGHIFTNLTVSLVLPLMVLHLPPSLLTLLREPRSIVTLCNCGSVWSSDCVCICTCCLRKCVEKKNERITPNDSSLNLNVQLLTKLAVKLLLFQNSPNAPLWNDSIWFLAPFLFASSSQNTARTTDELAAKNNKIRQTNTWNMLLLKCVWFTSQVVAFYRCRSHKLAAMNHNCVELFTRVTAASAL